jgi:hypothetical protein
MAHDDNKQAQPEAEKKQPAGTKDPTTTEPGEQQDDNIDDLGHPVNGTGKKTQDQPVK